MRESKPMAIESLKNMSQHPVENAWKLINFCDKKRCIFGAAPAEVVHCLQHGLFLYLFKCMFLQRKLNKSGRKRSLLITAKSNQKKKTIGTNQRNKNMNIDETVASSIEDGFVNRVCENVVPESV